MIVQIRGTDLNRNKAAHMTALFAATNAIMYGKKTLIIQMDHKPSIEDMLIGKELTETQIRDQFAFEDIGIEALLLRAASQGIRKEHFDTCCRQLMENNPNALDIAIGPKSDNFEETLLSKEEQFSIIIEQAKRVYDDIYICTNAKNHDMCQMVNKYTDTQVICIRQGRKEEVSDILTNKNNPNEEGDFMYVCTNYDTDSVFTFKTLKRSYNAKFIGYIVYNSELKDAYNIGNLLSFVEKNASIDESDVSFSLFNGIKKILERINHGELTAVEDVPNFEEFYRNSKELKPAAIPEIKEERRGLFKNKRVMTGSDGLIITDTDEEIEDLDYEEREKKSNQASEKDIEVLEEISLEEDDDTDEQVQFEDIPSSSESEIPQVELEEITPSLDHAKTIKEYAERMMSLTSIDEDLPQTKESEFNTPESITVEELLEELHKDDKPVKEDSFEEPNEDTEDLPTVEGILEQSKVIPMKPQTSAKDEWTCKTCGNKIPSRFKFCYECGEKAPQTCPRCGFELEENMKFCPECGERR